MDATLDQFDPKRLAGIQRLKDLLPRLVGLRDVGCARDTAGNRRLHFDEYVTLVLLYMLNPMIDSVRTLQRAVAVDRVAEQLGVRRFSLGSFSESVRVFDPEKLKAVIVQLAKELKPTNADPRLKTHLSHALTMVDGTVLDAVAKVTAAMWLPLLDGTAKYAWRLHVQFDFDTFVPGDVELTNALNSGASSEKTVLRKKLAPGRCYVMDRGLLQFVLFNEINALGSSYVCRAKEKSRFAVTGELPPSEPARQAGVIRDVQVQMGLGSKCRNRPDHPIRLIVIKAEPHQKRGGRRGKTAGPTNHGSIVIATNLLDVPAEIIALIYRYRWAIEIFFRFFKQILGCRHLVSHKPQGILIQVYCAIIACMLINLWTGKRPDKGMVQVLAWYLAGLATEAEVLTYINRPDNTGKKLAAKATLWKKLGY